jgi:hypothetical protein
MKNVDANKIREEEAHMHKLRKSALV